MHVARLRGHNEPKKMDSDAPRSTLLRNPERSEVRRGGLKAATPWAQMASTVGRLFWGFLQDLLPLLSEERPIKRLFARMPVG